MGVAKSERMVMEGVIAPEDVDDKSEVEHSQNMAADGLTVRIDDALAEELRIRAQAAGVSVEEYVLHRLKPDEPAPGFGERDAAYWEDVQRIVDETKRDGGVPWEQVEARLLNFGKKR